MAARELSRNLSRTRQPNSMSRMTNWRDRGPGMVAARSQRAMTWVRFGEVPREYPRGKAGTVPRLILASSDV
jgi:hypothetical protein